MLKVSVVRYSTSSFFINKICLPTWSFICTYSNLHNYVVQSLEPTTASPGWHFTIPGGQTQYVSRYLKHF